MGRIDHFHLVTTRLSSFISDNTMLYFIAIALASTAKLGVKNFILHEKVYKKMEGHPHSLTKPI